MKLFLQLGLGLEKKKKSLIYIVTILFTQAIANAQIPQENEYITNNCINKFQGTWKCTRHLRFIIRQ